MTAVVAATRVRRFAARQLTRLGYHLQSWSRVVYTPASEQQLLAWRRDQGDKTLRRDYALDASSLVLDLGGYEGQWSSDIFAMYGCTFHIFEPMPSFAQRIEQRFAQNPKIHVHAFGLAGEAHRAYLSEAADRSSLFSPSPSAQPIQLECAADFFQAAGFGQIDLLKVNIEGAEYELLEHLLASGWITRIINLQVQFHDFVPNAHQRMRAIQQALSKTHAITYQYPFIWENWQRCRPTSAQPAG
jgi:FkbM family methyltransferase